MANLQVAGAHRFLARALQKSARRAEGRKERKFSQSPVKSRHDCVELHVNCPGWMRGRRCQSAQRPLCSCVHQEGATPVFLLLHSLSSYFSLWRCVGLVRWVGAQRRQARRQAASMRCSPGRCTQGCVMHRSRREGGAGKRSGHPPSSLFGVPPPPPLSPREDGCKKMDSPGG